MPLKDTYADLAEQAYKTLSANDFKMHTRPAERLYPHQWLWDSCFIAIGLRHKDPARAVQEIASLFKGQWQNGMLPHILFSKNVDYHAGPSVWGSTDFDEAPKDVQTSCMTQPPMVAEAMKKIGEVLSAEQRHDFYIRYLPKLINYHLWLYRERDPKQTGQITLIHAWESGIENAPYWSTALTRGEPPQIRKARLKGTLTELERDRPDLKHAPLEQRPTSSEFYSLYHTLDVIREAGYGLHNVNESTDVPLINDPLFNAVLLRANTCLAEMAIECGIEIPDELQQHIRRSREVFPAIMASDTYQLFPSQDYRTGTYLRENSVAELMGVYAECTADDYHTVIDKLRSADYWPKYGIASTPVSSPLYDELRFWRGPVWINTNWLLIEGLERIGQAKLAHELTRTTLEMIGQSAGMHEYYGARSGKPAGANNFSWTAALTIDLIEKLKGQ